MNDQSWIGREAEPVVVVSPSRREAMVGGAFLLAAMAGLALKPRRAELLLGSAKLDDLIPQAFGNWHFEPASGLVLPPPDQLRDKIYSQLVTRLYSRADGASVMLLVAYSGAQDGTIQIHRPEVCYPASGFRLTENAAHTIPLSPSISIPGRYIVAEGNLRREQLIYWTRQGDHFPTKWSEQKTAVIAENFAGIIPDGILVRMSSTTPLAADTLFDGFARDLYAAVGARMRQVLVGRALSGAA